MKVGKLAYLVALFSVTSSSSTSGVAAHDDEDVGIDDGLDPNFLRGVMNLIANKSNENNAESSCSASDEWCDNDEDCCSQFCKSAGRGITKCFGNACKGYGNECRYNKECCDGLLCNSDGICSANNHNRQAPETMCTAGDKWCDVDSDCCSGFCKAINRGVTRCYGDACEEVGSDCDYGKECCSGECSEDGECIVVESCVGDGTLSDDMSCDADGECCSGYCKGGMCKNNYCKEAGRGCGWWTNDGSKECCSGVCDDHHCIGHTTKTKIMNEDIEEWKKLMIKG